MSGGKVQQAERSTTPAVRASGQGFSACGPADSLSDLQQHKWFPAALQVCVFVCESPDKGAGPNMHEFHHQVTPQAHMPAPS